MTTPSDTSAAPSRRSTAPMAVLAITTLGSLILSPITAVWALVVGPLLLVAGLLVSWLRPQGRGLPLLFVGVGVILGALPYFLLAALQA